MTDASAALPLGSFGGATAHGAAHIQHGKPNQDAFLGMNIGGWTVIAVADGHGSAPHFRSDRGARIAVESAHLAISQFTENGTADTKTFANLRANLSHLASNIVTMWRAAVISDINTDPVMLEAGRDLFMPYGSTCVVAAFGNGLSLFVQIGDGDIVVSVADGQLTCPLPDDDGMIGEQTYSLCQIDAAIHFRHALFAAPHPLAEPSFAMVATDGLSKSFVQRKQFEHVFFEWKKIVTDHGLAGACVRLEDWLSNVSRNGNGDDVTSMLYSLPRVSELKSAKASGLQSILAGPYILGKIFVYVLIAVIAVIVSVYKYRL